MSLVTQISDVVTSIGTQFKAAYVKIGDLSSLATTAKSSLVAAINELQSSISGAGATINDSAPSTSSVYSSSKTESVVADLIDDTTAASTTVYSSSKTDDQITAGINGVVNGAGAALDTLKELADAIGDDADFAGTMTTALGNRLRVDAAQSLTGTQQGFGQANLSVYSQAQIGDPTTDFVAVFNAALA